MFWDEFLNPVRDFLSNDISEWTVAALLTAFIVTKLVSVISGTSFEFRQELYLGVTIFLVFFGVFYLP